MNLKYFSRHTAIFFYGYTMYNICGGVLPHYILGFKSDSYRKVMHPQVRSDPGSNP